MLSTDGYYAKKMRVETPAVRNISISTGHLRMTSDIGGLLGTQTYLGDPNLLTALEPAAQRTLAERQSLLRILSDPEVIPHALPRLSELWKPLILKMPSILFIPVQTTRVYDEEAWRREKKGKAQHTFTPIESKYTEANPGYITTISERPVASPVILDEIWQATCQLLVHFVGNTELRVHSLYSQETETATLTSSPVAREVQSLLMRSIVDKIQAQLVGTSVAELIASPAAQKLWQLKKFWIYRELWWRTMQDKDARMGEKLLMTKLFLENIAILDTIYSEKYSFNLDVANRRVSTRHIHLLDGLLRTATLLEPLPLTTFESIGWHTGYRLKSSTGRWLFMAEPVYNRIKYSGIGEIEGQTDKLDVPGGQLLNLGGQEVDYLLPSGVDYNETNPGFYRTTRNPASMALLMTTMSPLMGGDLDVVRDLWEEIQITTAERQTARHFGGQRLERNGSTYHVFAPHTLDAGGQVDAFNRQHQHCIAVKSAAGDEVVVKDPVFTTQEIEDYAVSFSVQTIPHVQTAPFMIR